MQDFKDYGWSDSGQTCAHSYLFKDILTLINKNVNKTLLDIGCGNGYIANKLIKLGYNVYGIDASVSGIEIAKKDNPDRFFVHNIESNELPQELHGIKFDTILSTEVIEHLYDPKGYLNFCKKIFMKNNGGGGER